MKNIYFYFFCLLVFIFTSCQESSDTLNTEPLSGPLFELVDSEHSRVFFTNAINENNQHNHLLWSHVYSGAGVAAGDINNDGLIDLFFSGNIVGDAIYLNKGNMQFTDITRSAGIKQDGKWSTGVTFADVNNDGFLDIYVCRLSATMNPDDRRNLLYINNGNLTFTESAKAYGVDDGGFSIQSTFFDLDNDGDLDFFLANQPPDPRLLSRHNVDPESNKALWADKLYLNTGKGKFVDISKSAKVDGYGYGLSVVASDINGDNLTDLYVSNDYFGADFLYINNGDLSFTNTINQSVKHISNFAMGCDIGDINNDGLPDIGVVDMAAPDHFRSKTNMGSMRPNFFWKLVNDGHHYQYMFNTLQLNNGNNSFSEIGLQAGLSKTDWSWSLLMNDFDNDGFKDIAITNGIQRDIRNNDFQYKIKAMNEQGQTQFNIMDVVNLIPSTPIPNYLYKNDGYGVDSTHSLSFSDVSQEWGFNDPGFSAGMAVADLDNDGDLDMIINNVSKTASIYENKLDNRKNYIRFNLVSDSNKEYNAKVVIQYGEELQTTEITPSRGYMSASETIAHFGLGDQSEIDKVSIQWSDGKVTHIENPEINRTHTVNYKSSSLDSKPEENKKPIFAEVNISEDEPILHKENEFDDFSREILLPHKQSQNGPYLVKGDVNGDNLEDFFIGGASGFEGKLYLQQTDQKFKLSPSQPWSTDKQSEDLGCLLFDADNDNDLDLYVVSGGNEFEIGDKRYKDRLYINDGTGQFTKDEGALPDFRISGQAVAAEDIDGDGDLDLFVGGRLIPGKYPAPEDSYLLINENGKFSDATSEFAPELRQLGMVTDALFTDFDKDGDKDLIVVGEWMPVQVFENDGTYFSDQTEKLQLSDTRAWWWSIESGDFDNDGDDDYVIGNLGRNTKFKASKEKPFMVYGNDFDNNGTNDVVLANYYGKDIVPVRGRECSSEQMPFIAEKFPTFEGFAKADVQSIFSSEKLESAISYEVYSFESIILINNNTSFESKPLSPIAQISPLRDFEILDVNDDGHLDILGVGNMYGTEVETIRYDAGIGACLIGDGKGNFKALNNQESGFFAPHDSRSIVSLRSDNQKLILVGNNNEKLQAFRPTE